MPTRFDDLPTEIQLQIFETATKSQWTPRVVEIYFKDRQIFSKTLPPPLLHVCRTSREVVLKLYKPWLPQFKGMAVHEPWERRLCNKDVDKLSSLQNVCVSLEHDILLINNKQWSDWNFGHIERAYLRKLAVNLGGWLGWLSSRDFYLQFAHLKKLNLFDRGADQKTLSLKLELMKKVLTQAQKSRKDKGSKKRYVAPVVTRKEVPTAEKWQASVDEWITYKYPKDFKHTVPFRRPGRSWEEEVTGENESVASESQPARRRGRPRREEVAARQGTKRSRAEFEADILPQSGKRPRGRPWKVFVARDVDEQQIPRRESPQISVEDTFAKIRGYMESFRSPTPEAEPIRKPSPSPEPAATFQSPLDKYEFLRDLKDEDSPEPGKISPSLCMTFVDPRIAFNGQRKDSVERPGIQELTPPPSSPFVDPRVAFHDLFENFNESEVTRDSDSIVGEDDDVLPSEFGSASEKVLPENPSKNYDYEEEVVELDSNFGLDSERDNDNNHAATEIETPVFELPDPLAAEPECQTLDVPAFEDEEYAPKQFMAERKTAEGLQFLVQWQDYPEEKDWTWETEAAMIESAPDMVTAWVAKSEAEVEEENPVTVDYIVEKILGRRKFKGVPHYLVKWKGYEEVKDRTWEPCERLSVDVPLIVEAFEEKKRKK